MVHQKGTVTRELEVIPNFNEIHHTDARGAKCLDKNVLIDEICVYEIFLVTLFTVQKLLSSFQFPQKTISIYYKHLYTNIDETVFPRG
jgi:hypothetical protein